MDVSSDRSQTDMLPPWQMQCGFLSALLAGTGSCRIAKGVVVEKGKVAPWTHLCMTGGKWKFPSLDVPPAQPVCVKSTGIEDSGDRLTWPEGGLFWAKSHGFRRAAPTLLNRPATIEEMFWIAYLEWTKFVQTKDGDRSPDNFNVCLVECVTPIFRMFIDLDFKDRTVMTTSGDVETSAMNDRTMWRQILQHTVAAIQGVVKSCFPSHDLLNVTVLTTPSAVRAKDGWYKRGVHLVWPGLLVDKTMAIQLVAMIECELLRSGPPRTALQNSYAEAIDKSVYSTGLRMPGGPKAELCEVCGVHTRKVIKSGGDNARSARAQTERVRLFCPEHIRFPSGYMFRPETVYRVVWVVDTKGRVVNRQLDMKALGQWTDTDGTTYDLTLKSLASIRSSASEPTSGFRLLDGYDRQLLGLSIDEDERFMSRYCPRTDTILPPRKHKALCDRITENPSEAKRSRMRKNGYPIVIDDEVLKYIQSLFQGLDVHWSRIALAKPYAHVADVRTTMPDGRLVTHREVSFTCIGPNETYCWNKGDHHAHSTVKCIVLASGMVVAGCWCPKRYNGRVCKTSTSKAIGMRTVIDTSKYPLLYALLTAKAHGE
jgi:hypothetical protein